MGAVAPIAAVAMTVGSSVMGAAGEKSAYDAGARADLENARRTELDGALAEEAIRRQGRAVQGEAIAALGANGGRIGTGSALDLLWQNQVEIEYDVLNRRYSASSEATSLRAAAAQKKKAGKFALIGGLMRAGAQALTGIGDVQNAAASAATSARLRTARLPGGQSLPIPAALGGR
ncbi:MAG TPA: hypothetical protein VF628_02345 [Allosphingosinicella sp.]|jgi:hypothetical protein